MLNRINQTVKTLLNKETQGNYTPTDFNLFVNLVVNEKYDLLLHEVNKLINRQNRGLINGGLENTVELLRQKIEHYLEPDVTIAKASGKFALPSDLRYFDCITFPTFSGAGDLDIPMAEMMKSRKQYNTALATNPTEEFPIGFKQGNYVYVAPTTISSISVSYLRSPAEAKWTYSIVSGEEIYNPSASDFVDIDIHNSEETDVTMRILEKFGVNLSEKEITEYAQREETTDFQIKNQA